MRVAVYGSGGHGKVVADILAAASEHEVIGFLDDDPKKAEGTVGGLPVHLLQSNLRERARQLKFEAVALGIGDNEARASIVERCRAGGVAIVQAIHPRATIAPTAELGSGVVIMAGAVVDPVPPIHQGACINTSPPPGHDFVVYRYVHILPRGPISGTAGICEFSYVGVGGSA